MKLDKAARTAEISARDSESVEVSVVLPCLNDGDTLAICIEKAWRGLKAAEVQGEVIVADNGSTDDSHEIAIKGGARLIPVPQKGYGHALMGGIAAARGKFIIMGDSDDSYDFLEIPKFVAKLREGSELVQGCRLPRGGGTVMPGAMPFLHRWSGNPMLTMMARWWFRAPINDIYCGMRGFTKELYLRLGQRCTGMEFATENVIKSTFFSARISEVPITLHPDGRKTHAPHLRTFRDGWRTVRLFIMYTPRWLFLVPGGLLVLLGMFGYILGLPPVHWNGITFGAHTLLFASLAILCGYQSILFAIFTKTFAIAEGLMPEDPKMMAFYNVVNLEKGLICGFAALLIGLAMLLVAVNRWRLVGFGQLDYFATMRWVIPATTLTALGFQTILSSFFVSILGMKRR